MSKHDTGTSALPFSQDRSPQVEPKAKESEKSKTRLTKPVLNPRSYQTNTPRSKIWVAGGAGGAVTLGSSFQNHTPKYIRIIPKISASHNINPAAITLLYSYIISCLENAIDVEERDTTTANQRRRSGVV